MDIEQNEHELIDRFVEAIRSIPDATAHVCEQVSGQRTRSYAIDAIVDAAIGGRSLRILVEAKREAFPRDVRGVIGQLRTYQAAMPESDRQLIPVFVSRAISPGARDILRDEQIGYYDLGGSLFLPADGAYVFIDRPIPKKDARALENIFQGQRARVLLEVFQRREDAISVKSIAEGEEVSAATVSETLRELERREWVDAEGSGPAKLRRLSKPTALVDAWAAFKQIQPAPNLTRYYVPGGDVEAMARKLAEACRQAGADYAITGEFAAQIYAPYLSSISQVKCRIARGRELDTALRHLGARQVAEGWNFGLIETRARGDVTVGEEIDGLRLAPPLIVYLDLLQSSGRAREMAEHLRTERIGA